MELDNKKETKQIRTTIDYLKKIIYFNQQQDGQKKIVFVSGNAGCGKTLAALKLLYDYNNYQLENNGDFSGAVYLSKNSHLLDLLSEIKQFKKNEINQTTSNYLRSLKDYKLEYMNSPKIPHEEVIIIDETERLWDEAKMNGNISEAEVLLKIANNIYRAKKNVTIICFLDQRQAIHTGEELGFKLWQKALTKRGINNWQVYASPSTVDCLQGVENLLNKDKLKITNSLRSSFIAINSWIKALLDNDFKSAKQYILDLADDDFLLRVTRDFSKAKEFITKQSSTNKNLTTGLLISSKSWTREIKPYINEGKYFGSFMEPEEIKAWFKEDSQKLNKAGSEFACRGLELDYTIVCFGGDYYLDRGAWQVDSAMYKYHSAKYRDFKKIVKNIYWTLLSRAKQGMVLYIPEMDKLNNSYQFLKKIGLKEL